MVAQVLHVLHHVVASVVLLVLVVVKVHQNHQLAQVVAMDVRVVVVYHAVEARKILGVQLVLEVVVLIVLVVVVKVAVQVVPENVVVHRVRVFALTPAIEDFAILSHEELRYSIDLPDTESVRALFMMTPYAYRTSREDRERVLSLSEVTTEVEFVIDVYEKI